MSVNLSNEIAKFSHYHQSRANRVCHYFAIPTVTIAILGALARVGKNVTLGEWVIRCDMAIAVLLLTLFVDLWINWRIAIGVFLGGIICYLTGRVFSPLELTLIFCIGISIQIFGHHFLEKNKPAFTDNLIHLFVGPRWLVSQLINTISVK